ncbi:MAG: hemerythrin domain-containing protein [Ferruginibacter sp.]
MKRHPSLAHLSRDHHGALILARLLQKDAPAYKGLPADTEGKAAYAIKFYREELVKHFEDEEKVLKLVTGINATLDPMLAAIFKEHAALHESFKAIQLQSPGPEFLDGLGKALEKHIRTEERELFPLIQESCSEDLLKRIDQSLSPDAD